jgi:carbon monoxide dehydrogenase subunit G
MKILKRVLLTLGIILGLLLVVSLFLPSKYEVKREGTVKAPADSVFMWVADLKNWQAWSPWHQADPGMKITYSPTTIGPGAFMQWASESQGNGTLTFKSIVPPGEASYELDMGEGMASTGKFMLIPQGNETKVIWTMGGDVGMNPLYKYVVLFMDDFVGPDFEKGINNLQKRADKKAAANINPSKVTIAGFDKKPFAQTKYDFKPEKDTDHFFFEAGGITVCQR